jgi:hemerythrin
MLVWDDTKYGTGNALVDTQHKGLFKTINELIEAMTQGKGKEEVAKIIEVLQKYTQKHFSDEENIMEQHACSVRQENKAAHKKFIETFLTLKKQFEEEGPSSALAIKMQFELGMWLVKHIGRCDKKLGECQASNN